MSIEETAFYASSFYTPLLYTLYDGWLIKGLRGSQWLGTKVLPPIEFKFREA